MISKKRERAQLKMALLVLAILSQLFLRNRVLTQRKRTEESVKRLDKTFWLSLRGGKNHLLYFRFLTQQNMQGSIVKKPWLNWLPKAKSSKEKSQRIMSSFSCPTQYEFQTSRRV